MLPFLKLRICKKLINLLNNIIHNIQKQKSTNIIILLNVHWRNQQMPYVVEYELSIQTT